MKVKIKSWKQLEQEFGVHEEGEVACTFGFTRDMEQALLENRIIDVRAVARIDDAPIVYLCSTEGLKLCWFSDDMFEEIIEE